MPAQLFNNSSQTDTVKTLADILLSQGSITAEQARQIKFTEIQTGKTQEVVLSMKNYNYYPNTIKVKSDIPVRIYLDESVVGCYRGFTIRDFGINKYLKTPEDYIEFTPNKKGTFVFACSMGMGTGKIIVE